MIVADDIQHADDARADPLRSLGLHVCATYSLLSGARLLGTLSFASRTRAAFTASELEFMR